MFDINDFDETATGPWEWDIKRLAVSVEIAGRNIGLKEKERHDAVYRCVKQYRETLREFSQMGFLDRGTPISMWKTASPIWRRR